MSRTAGGGISSRVRARLVSATPTFGLSFDIGVMLRCGTGLAKPTLALRGSDAGTKSRRAV